MSISVSRTINGISLNGDEWLLDEDGEVMLFESEEVARNFLSKSGLNEEEINSYDFNQEVKD
ncbi:hypothetical protein LCGC14_2111350 [marine sediment metagenome]|uniref:Uncharacterized protein n=1 Tax=marine sediment metagenome TaxID=412755 RepID=A0A0F9E745_9ZZZZ